jgi:hypothetical protein
VEYMAYALPSVSFDLVETRVSAGNTGILVAAGNLDAFATQVERLLDKPRLRMRLGLAARHRVAAELDWQPQAQAYVGVFDELMGRVPDAGRRSRWPFAARPVTVTNAAYVDLADESELERFIVTRTRPAVRLPELAPEVKPLERAR